MSLDSSLIIIHYDYILLTILLLFFVIKITLLWYVHKYNEFSIKKLLLLSVTMAVICIYYYNMEFILIQWVSLVVWWVGECVLKYGAGAGGREYGVANIEWRIIDNKWMNIFRQWLYIVRTATTSANYLYIIVLKTEFDMKWAIEIWLSIIHSQHISNDYLLFFCTAFVPIHDG